MLAVYIVVLNGLNHSQEKCHNRKQNEKLGYMASISFTIAVFGVDHAPCLSQCIAGVQFPKLASFRRVGASCDSRDSLKRWKIVCKTRAFSSTKLTRLEGSISDTEYRGMLLINEFVAFRGMCSYKICIDALETTLVVHISSVQLNSHYRKQIAENLLYVDNH